MAAALTIHTTHYVPYCLARAAMEAGSQALWVQRAAGLACDAHEFESIARSRAGLTKAVP
jgi:hypothetical protein